MPHGRIDAAGRFVVFQNMIGPPRKTYGLKAADAFALILERCGYTAKWGTEDDRITLGFQLNGQTVPVRFELPMQFGFEFDKEFVMSAVFENGLKGWKALPSDMHTIVHGIAEQELRNPSRTWGLGTLPPPR